jgi:hypothetical protein
MSDSPQPALPERRGVGYVSALAQMWAAVEPEQQRIDKMHVAPRGIDELAIDFLESNDPYPVGSRVFAVRWRPGQWRPGRIIRRADVDQWTVAFFDGGRHAFRDHAKLCPAFLFGD